MPSDEDMLTEPEGHQTYCLLSAAYIQSELSVRLQGQRLAIIHLVMDVGVHWRSGAFHALQC